MPNYDLPNAAPEPLRQVQLLVNSVDREHGYEWLPDWLGRHGLDESSLERATALREAFRKLLHANNVGGSAPDAVKVVDDFARKSVRPELHEDGVVLTG